MATRVTFTLDEEAYAFLCAVGGRNKSAFINSLLKKERRMYLTANLEEADADYQQKLTEWDVTALDGIDP